MIMGGLYNVCSAGMFRLRASLGVQTTALVQVQKSVGLNMETAVFNFWLLFLLFSPTVPMCLPTDFTLYVEKPECDYCVAINTTICMGFCYSRDSNMKSIRFPIQRGCTYDRVEYHSAILPGCPIDSNPVFTYPVALSCHCGACRTDSDECTHRTSADRVKCSKPVTRIYPFPAKTIFSDSTHLCSTEGL
ncbi:thyrotropin subunit beta-like [Solea senegalensis]|uniref:Gonadotropin subunit beta-2 n=1 Tax=Solea senegalensis TaxID=28829 RepID=A0AAV6QRB8_SOLSE|nr:thyrotropin subunit beta-like [Solea senegalensis]